MCFLTSELVDDLNLLLVLEHVRERSILDTINLAVSQAALGGLHAATHSPGLLLPKALNQFTTSVSLLDLALNALDLGFEESTTLVLDDELTLLHLASELLDGHALGVIAHHHLDVVGLSLASSTSPYVTAHGHRPNHSTKTQVVGRCCLLEIEGGAQQRRA
jgi:hypothetical protein